MTIIQTIAKELSSAFATDTRADGATFQKISDDAPAWLRDNDENGQCLMLRVHRAVDDRMPDDWIYQHASLIADALCEYDDVDTMHERETEIVDGLVDVYNSELTRWLHAHLGNVALCDEGVEEIGVGNAGGVIGHIQAGQYLALDRIAHALISEIEAQASVREEGSAE